MPAAPRHPTRYCSQCKLDWPQYAEYNLCPKCQRCTVAETSRTRPDETSLRVLANQYAAFYKWLGDQPATDIAGHTDMSSFEAAIAATPDLPVGDPSTFKKPGEYDVRRGRLAPGPSPTFPDDAIQDGA